MASLRLDKVFARYLKAGVESQQRHSPFLPLPVKLKDAERVSKLIEGLSERETAAGRKLAQLTEGEQAK